MLLKGKLFMKNILNETAKDELIGRTKFVFDFIQKEDIRGKKY